MSTPALPYTTVVGLEVHVQLLTRTKLFCGCSTEFGLPPNSATCPVCVGMPGVLPVGVSVEDGGDVTGPPVGGVPVAVASLWTMPASGLPLTLSI